MRFPILISSLIVSLYLGYKGMGIIKSGKESKEVLSYNVENEITPTPTPEPTPTPTTIPTPSPTPTPTPTLVPQPNYSSEEINGFIERFAAQYGVSPHVVRHIAVCESGFNPFATKLSYVGLFQFTDFTWEKYRLQMGEDFDPDLRSNAEEAVQTAAYVLSIGDTNIWPNCVP